MNTATANSSSTSSSVTPGIKTTSIKADGIDIRCLEAGSGQPLVYLHGAGGLRLSVAHRALAENHHLIALELPGFGKTPANATHTSARAIAATMANAMRALGIEACPLMGHSLGANVALWLAIDHPGLAKTLILVAPTAIRPDDSGIGGARPKEVAAQNPAHLWFSEVVGGDSLAAVRGLAQTLSGPPRDAELEKAMGGVAVPVLVLFGTRSVIVSTDAAREYTRALPKCFSTLVYDAGHDIDLDRPEAVAAVVRNFLQNGESFIVNRDNGMINP